MSAFSAALCYDTGAAEKEIEMGNFKVNGQRATIGQKIDPDNDEVEYKGKLVKGDSKKVYVMLYKPRGYVTTMSDDEGRKCIPELLKDIPERVYPCGRLDMDSEGLLILTNDGEVANKLMHPKHHVEKIYHVKVKGEIEPNVLITLNGPMVIDDYKIKPVQVSIIERKEGNTILRFILSEGRNRQIRKMCEAVGLEVARLKRTAIGPVKLGMLKPGTYRELTSEELRALRSAMGDK